MRAFRKVLATVCIGAVGVGLLFMIIGASIGGNAMNREDLVEIHEEYEGVENINLKVDFGELRIEKGERFAIYGTDIYEDAFQVDLDNGNWNITYGGRGFRVLWGGYSTLHSVLVVTVPEQKFGRFDLNMGAGKCVMETVEGEKVTIRLGAGTLSADGLFADQKLKLDVGAGEAVVRDAKAAEADLSCGAGRLVYSGDIIEKGRVSCGAGEADLTLDGRREEYGFSGSWGIGVMEVNGVNRKTGIGSVELNEGVSRKIRFSCGVGKIKVTTAD